MADSASRPSPFAFALAVVPAAIGMMGKFPTAASASFVRISFPEVAQSADLIFVGRVTGRNCAAQGSSGMIFTQVHFGEVQAIPGHGPAGPGGALGIGPDRSFWPG